MGKNRTRGGYRQASNPAPVSAPGPGAGKGMNRTDGGPGSAKIPLKQPIRRLPNAKSGENKAFVEGQQAVNGLSRTAPTGEQIVKQNKPEVFTGTELVTQDPRAGGATGQSIGIEEIASAQDDVNILLDVLDARNQNNIYIKQLKNTRARQNYNFNT
jgi:hypothetical protein